MARYTIFITGLVCLVGSTVFAVPPEAISDLTALAGVNDGEISLQWTAPSDSDGDMSGYILRYSTTGNIENNVDYSTATFYLQITTSPSAGSPQSRLLTGLIPGVTYFWAVKSYDAAGSTSSWSRAGGVNSVNWAAAQDVAPGAPAGLALTPGNAFVNLSWSLNTEPDINLYEINSSSYSDTSGFSVIGTTTQPNVVFQHTGLVNGNTYYYKLRVLDNTGNYSVLSGTKSAMPQVALNAPAWSALTVALSTYSIRWNWNDVSNELGYRVFNSTSGENLTGDLGANTTYWIETGLAANKVYSRYIQAVNGLITANSVTTTYYTLAAIPASLTSTAQTVSAIDLSWNANGNPDGTRYNVEHSSTGVSGWSLRASLITSTTFQDTGLAEKTTYYYRLDAVNGDGAVSGYSSPAFSRMTASIAPAAINSLGAAAGVDDGLVELSWVSPGDDGTSGTAAKYIVHYATFDINSSNFDSPGVSTFTQTWVPLAGGSVEGFGGTRIVTGLYPGTTYYFAIKAEDGVGNRGSWPGPAPSKAAPDFAPPVPTGLSAVPSGNQITLSWNLLTGEPDIASYRVFCDSTPPYDFSDEFLRCDVSGSSCLDPGLANETTYYYRMKAVDTGPSGDFFSTVLQSNYSSSVSAMTPDIIAPGSITGLSAFTGATEGKINLTWTSPGDDGYSKPLNGSFRIDYSTNPSYVFSYSSFKINIPTSTIPGAGNAAVVSGLTGGATYYFAIFSGDDAGNFSGISNGATAYAQVDVTPPSTIADLAPVGAWKRVSLSWTSPGDDGNSGVLNGAFQIRYSTVNALNTISEFNAAPYEILVATSVVPGVVVSTTVTDLFNGTTYYFAVRARDESGNYSQLYASGPQAVPGNTMPGTFNLVSPVPGANGFAVVATQTPLFDWSDSVDSDVPFGDSLTYTIEYSTSSSFEVAVTTKVSGLAGSSFTPAQPIAENSLVWWKVTAVDLQNARRIASNGPWRVGINVVNSAPLSFNLLSPANGGTVDTLLPALDWEDSIDADPGDTVSYKLEYSTNPNFSGPVVISGISSSNYTLTNPLVENAVYWWRITSSDGSLQTRSNQENSFMVNATGEPPSQFSLSAPTDNSRQTTLAPLFQWQAATDPDPGSAVTYTLIYSNLSSFASSVTVTGLLTNSYQPPAQLADNSYYYWYVKAVDNTGLARNSTDSRRFYTDLNKELPGEFELLTPTGSIKIQTLQPVFDWTDALDPDPADTVRYFIEISPKPDFSGAIPIPTGVDSFFIPTSDLQDQTTYYWRVKAGGYIGVPPSLVDPSLIVSNTGTFAVSLVNTPPGKFDLLAPANGSVVNTQSPSFDWTDSVDKDLNDQVTYKLKLSTSSDFSTYDLYDAGDVSGLSSTVTLLENRKYYWKAMAIDKSGAVTESNTVFNFNVPVITIPKEPTGINGAISVDRVRFTLAWTGVAENTDGSLVSDLAGYNIYRSLFSATLGQEPPVAYVNKSFTSWTDVSANGGGYYYMVRAVDASGVESADSVAAGSGVNTTFVAVAEDKGAEVHLSGDSALILRGTTNSRNEDLRLHLARRTGDEVGRVLRSYCLEVKPAVSDTVLSDFVFDKPIEVAFPLSELQGSLSATASDGTEAAIFWHNDVEFINLGGRYDARRGLIYVATQHAGTYQLRNVLRASSFGLVQIWPGKVFTPNGDGINDVINFVVDNPRSSVFSGKIYNLSGLLVGELKQSQDENTLIWDGKDSGGGFVNKGVYIYQIKSEDKIINGTVVVAK